MVIVVGDFENMLKARIYNMWIRKPIYKEVVPRGLGTTYDSSATRSLTETQASYLYLLSVYYGLHFPQLLYFMVTHLQDKYSYLHR